MTALEQDIVRRMVAFLTTRGWALGHSTLKTHEDVCRFLSETGMAQVSFRRTSDGARARVLLIEGNGEDIVSDYSAAEAVFDAFDHDMGAFLDTLDARPADARPA